MPLPIRHLTALLQPRLKPGPNPLLRPALALLCLLPALACATATPQFAATTALPENGILVVPVGEGNSLPESLSPALSSALGSAMQAADYEAAEDTDLSLFAVASYQQVILLGLGDKALTQSRVQAIGGRIARLAGQDRVGPVAILWNQPSAEVSFPGAHLALGLQLGSYRFDKYKSAPEGDEKPRVDTRFVIYMDDSEANAADFKDNWAGVADGVIFARDLITEPANVVYPETFVERTREAFKGLPNVSIKVLNEKQMDKLGMGALVGVGQGSERPPRLLLVQYSGGVRGSAPLAFVGKGVTFDSGGISLKRSNGMWKMKYDMSGAAAVTGTVLALAKRSAPVNAVAVAALVENMPSQKAQRPGDVRGTMSGKTIEVLNTDAEGRLILADGVWYTQAEYNPALLVDVATLTGSVRTALGTSYAGLFTRQDDLAGQFVAAGETAGEEVWRLPLHEDFRKAIKSDIADIKNVVEGGSGGASIGAEVIGTFVKQETRWVHLDIAGMAWATSNQPTVPKGAVGWGIRLLNQVVLDFYQLDTH